MLRGVGLRQTIHHRFLTRVACGVRQVGIICIITGLATFSVVSGLRKGLLPFSLLTFGLGNLLLFMMVYLDNTWYEMATCVYKHA